MIPPSNCNLKLKPLSVNIALEKSQFTTSTLGITIRIFGVVYTPKFWMPFIIGSFSAGVMSFLSLISQINTVPSLEELAI